MKKYWGILGTVLLALTLAGCGNHSQAKSSDTKKVTTHKVVKKGAPKVKKAAAKTAATTKSNTSTAFSDRFFASAWIDSISGIGFKGDQFIWKYTSPTTVNSDNEASSESKMIIMQGTYNYDSSSKVITLNIANQSKTYTGDALKLDKFNYQNVAAPSVAGTVKLQYSDDNGVNLLPITGNFVNLNLQEIKNDGKYPALTYNNLISNYSVSKVDSSMQKEPDGINSAEDFKQFIIKYAFSNNNIDPDKDIDINVVANDGKDYDIYSIDDMSGDTPDKTVKAKYTMHTSIHLGGSEKFILGDDNNIYSSPENQEHNTILQDASDKYHELYGN